MITVTPKAVAKIKELMPADGGAIRFGVQGGGCSGFSYAMQWENEKGPMDKEFEFDGLKVIVDATSLMYLDGVTVDYLETLESSGFKFDNPNVKSTCGCGQSFSA
jgi:iron-sulfur cluster assembly accessory protein